MGFLQLFGFGNSKPRKDLKSNEVKLYESTIERERKTIDELKEKINVITNEFKQLQITSNKQIMDLTKLNMELQLQINTQNTSINSNNDVNNKLKTDFVEIIEPKELTNKEKDIYERVGQVNNFNELLKVCGMKETSLRVYLSRIKKKGYSINFNDN